MRTHPPPRYGKDPDLDLAERQIEIHNTVTSIFTIDVV